MMNEKFEINTVATEFATRPAVVNNVVEKEVAMTASAMIGTFAVYVQAIIDDSDAASKMCERESLAANIGPYFEDLLVLRILQIMRKRPPQERYQDVEVPACFYPVLELVGDYKGVDDGTFLNPSNKGVLKLKLEQRQRISRLLRVAGMPMSVGLPRAVSVATDVLYRLAIQDGKLVSCGGVNPIDPATLLVRTFLEFQPLVDVYGPYRFAYQEVALVGTAYMKLASLGVK